MLRDRATTVDVFTLVPALELRFEPELAELDRLLEDHQIFHQVKADLRGGVRNPTWGVQAWSGMPRIPYPTDVSDAEWAILELLLPAAKRLGRPRADLRQVFNAIRYVTRSGAQWRMVPRDLVPWGTAWSYFRRWREDGTWQRLHDALRADVRRATGRDPQPSAAILDSQSVKTGERGGGERGFDGAKLIKGRKRHLLVDTLGLVHGLLVHSAGVQDRTGGRLVLEHCRGRMPRLRRIWADGAYRGLLVCWVRRTRRWVLQIISRPPGSNGFVLLKWRWILERTFGWLNLSRRLSKDYEVLPPSSEAFIGLAMLSIMLQRLARQR